MAFVPRTSVSLERRAWLSGNPLRSGLRMRLMWVSYRSARWSLTTTPLKYGSLIMRSNFLHKARKYYAQEGAWFSPYAMASQQGTM